MRGSLEAAASLVALACLTAAAPGVALVEVVDREQLAPGVRLVVYETDDNALLHTIHVSAGAARIRIDSATAGQNSGRGRTAQEVRAAIGALAVVTFDLRSPPLDSAWLCADGSRVAIGEPPRADIGRLRDCIGAGPALLRHGSAPAENAEAAMKQRRGFACTTRRGGLVLGVSDEMSLRRLTEILRDGALQCDDALELTGGAAAALATAADVFGEPKATAPAVIAVLGR